jgi:hypothetical protein
MKPWIILLMIIGGLLVLSVAIANQPLPVLSLDSPAHPGASAGERRPVVVELFTSEGCSSCPPADELLTRLEQTQPIPGAEIIALSEHVDYWNDLGWADPFSSSAFSARQRAYAQAFRNDGVYTPQMVVDGQAEFVGSNLARARAAIEAAARAPKAMVAIARAGANGGTVSFRVRVEGLPPASPGDTAEVLLAITEDDLQSQVARGENAGRRLRHTATVRWLEVIGSIEPQATQPFIIEKAIALAPQWKREKLRAVALVQQQVSRRVLGAAAMALVGK